MTAIATQRVTVLVSPREKAQFEAKAKRLGLKSVGELVRVSVKHYPSAVKAHVTKRHNGKSLSDKELEAELVKRQPELDALLTLMEESNRRANRALDEAEQALDATLAHFAAKKQR